MSTLDLSNLSADTAHRFRLIGELLKAYEQDMPGELELLDVGGYPGTFARLFTAARERWTALTLDTPKEDLPNYVNGSGMEIPFDDQRFEAVISIDTFEHIPPADRATFLTELCRVSSDIVILAAPFHHNATAAVERLLNAAHEKHFKMPHPWLGEHVVNGLPSLEKAVKTLPEEFGIVDVRQSYDLAAWTSWQSMFLYRKLRGELDESWELYDHTLAVAPTPAVTSVPYRYVLVARRDHQGRPGASIMPAAPESGREAVEMATFYSRLFDLIVPQGDQATAVLAAQAVDERLREALKASEKEIAELRHALGGRAPAAGKGGRILSKFFGRDG